MNTYICVFFLLLEHKANHFHLVFANFSLFMLFEKGVQISKGRGGGGGSVAPNDPPPPLYGHGL